MDISSDSMLSCFFFNCLRVCFDQNAPKNHFFFAHNDNTCETLHFSRFSIVDFGFQPFVLFRRLSIFSDVVCVRWSSRSKSISNLLWFLSYLFFFLKKIYNQIWFLGSFFYGVQYIYLFIIYLSIFFLSTSVVFIEFLICDIFIDLFCFFQIIFYFYSIILKKKRDKKKQILSRNDIWNDLTIVVLYRLCVLNAALKHSPSKKKLSARTRATSVTDSSAPANYDQLAASQESGNKNPHTTRLCWLLFLPTQHLHLPILGVKSSARHLFLSFPLSILSASSDTGVVVVASSSGLVQSATTGSSALSGPTGVVVSAMEAAKTAASATGGGGNSTPVNLPAVLKDRVPNTLRPGGGGGGGSRGPPPPVPPRSPKRANVNAPATQTSSAKGDHLWHERIVHFLLFFREHGLRCFSVRILFPFWLLQPS